MEGGKEVSTQEQLKERRVSRTVGPANENIMCRNGVVCLANCITECEGKKGQGEVEKSEPACKYTMNLLLRTRRM